MANDDFAVVVGICRYPALGDLEGPENDADAFEGWLTSPTGGAVPAANVKKIRSSDYQAPNSVVDAKPTTEAVQEALDELFIRGDANGGHAGRRLYLFLAGHGFASELDEAALLMANAARGRTGYHIPGRPWAEWFRKAAFFDEVVLFMDCCRENYPRAPLRFLPWEALSAAHSARYFYGLATDWSKAARERAWNGSVRGVFSRALIEGLSAAVDDNGAITGASLESHVYDLMTKEAADRAVQEPKFFYDHMDQVVFVTGKTVVIVLRVPKAAVSSNDVPELRDGSLQLLPPPMSGSEFWEWRLTRRGIYQVKVGDITQLIELNGERDTVDVAI